MSKGSENNPSTLSITLSGRKSMSDVRTIRVFIASPGDLAVERAAFKQVLEELNVGFGFRKSLEESRQVLSHGFANEAEFKAEVDRHLRAFAKGELPPVDA